MAVKSAFAGAGGLASALLLVAQRSDVDIQQSGELRLAQPDLCADALMAIASTLNLREGARLPRTISFICVMLRTSSLNSFLFMVALLRFTSLR